MPAKRKTRQNLKKGDNVVANIEDIINDCLIVSFIYQNRKFCGALMDTTKSIGPFGIPSPPEVKAENENEELSEKYQAKAPFPAPLTLRQTYNLDVPQPPLKNIFRRMRRSRRRVKLQRNLAAKDKTNSSHATSCACKQCSKPSTSTLAKRKHKELTPAEIIDNKLKRVKFNDDTPSTSSDEEQRSKIHEEIASPIKSLMPRTIQSRTKEVQSQKEEIQRSPIIKITFNTPGGKGKILKIPSRLHGSPVKSNSDTVSGQPVETPDPVVAPIRKKRPYIRRKYLVPETDPGIHDSSEKIKLIKKRQYMSRKTGGQNFPVMPESMPYSTKMYLKQDQAMKVLKRVKLSSVNGSPSALHKTKKFNHFPNSKLSKTNSSLAAMGATLKLPSPQRKSGKYDKDLRVILKPLDDKNGYILPPQSCRLSEVVGEVSDIAELEEQPGVELASKLKNSQGPPKRHIMTVSSCKTPHGVITQGDVVWGKLMGYPWWPSRVIKIIVTKTDGKILQQEAVVGWFQSRTTSTISVLSVESFRKSFDIRFQKKRKGVKYQRAVEDAKNALKEMTPEVRKLISQFET